MGYEFVKTERIGNILLVTMNRPEMHNAGHPPMSMEMHQVWEDFAADPELWVSVLTGAGDKAFCAGLDLKFTHSGQQVRSAPTGFMGLHMRFDMEKPIIGAVNGVAMGGGFETALCCDIVIASQTARFSLPEVKVGLFAAAGGVQRLSRHIGRKAAVEMMLTGRTVSAEEGLRLGFVNEVVPQEKCLERALEKAREIVAVSPSSVRATKRALNSIDEMEGLRSSLGFSRATLADLKLSEDFAEGVTAFVEKRKPQWKNR